MRISTLAVATAAALGAMLVAGAASAQSQPFVGQLMLFAGNFCPRGWVQADGQLMPISQNTALFSILGTTYGGDGKRTFALPKLAAPNVAGVPAGTGLSWCIALYGVYPSRS